MKPVSHDFDVITDAPAPIRRLPQQAEPAPQAGAAPQRRRAAPAERDRSGEIQAAE